MMARPRGGYHTKDGRKAPGTTSVEPARPGLEWWNCTVGLEAGYEAGLAGEPCPSVWDARKSASSAADAGTLAHRLFEAHLRGKNATPMEVEEADEDVRAQAFNAFENAKRWLADTGFRVEPLETHFVSEAHAYGGTPDAKLTGKDGRVYVGDWKSGGVYASSIVQVAAYRNLLRESGEDVDEAHVVRFPRQGGGYTHRLFDAATLDDAFRLFLLWREGYDITARLEKIAKA